mmetsp:Transcript_77317/g.94798  ORF Transcript_77317/g.94798 Transcript_77317/m.94798 type:complete len:110 (+) Transcript_77317:95-424(+)
MGTVGGHEEYTLLIKVIAKYIVLFFFQYASTLWLFITVAIQAIGFGNVLVYTLFHYGILIDIHTNMLALYLQYKFAEKDYYKCCKFCDQFMFYCIKPKKKQISNNTQDI